MLLKVANRAEVDQVIVFPGNSRNQLIYSLTEGAPSSQVGPQNFDTGTRPAYVLRDLHSKVGLVLKNTNRVL